MRHLIGNLEREAIELAHVWPKTYPSLEPGRENCCCFWFVGLEIKKDLGGQTLDLTSPIKKFTELVMGTAVSIGRWKEGGVMLVFSFEIGHFASIFFLLISEFSLFYQLHLILEF